MIEENNEEQLKKEELNEELNEGQTTEQPDGESQPTPEEEETQQTEEEDKAEEAKELTPEEKLAKAQEEIDELKDTLLRKIAEFDNYRKRTIKEKTELILNGGEKTIVAILPVIDDMERAMKNMQKTEDVNAVLEGVELIYKKFLGILEKQGVKTIPTEKADFNVDLHEAIAQLPAPNDEMKGKIMDCTLTGYTMNDKVIRHAQVVVAL